MTKVSAHLQKATKNVIRWGNLYIDFLILLTENIVHWFWRWWFSSTALVNFKIVLKIQIEVSQNPRGNTYARVSFWKRYSDTGVFLWTLTNFLEHLFGKWLFLKTWKLIYDGSRKLSDKKLFWKYWGNMQEHTCIRLQLLSYKLHET